VLTAFAPIWALTAVGFLVGRSRVLGSLAVDVLGRFVFYVAMPAALLSMLTRHPLTGLAGQGFAAFAIGTVVAGGSGFAMSRWVFHRPLGDQAIGGMAAGYVNAANLGIPVIVQVIGNASFVAVVLLLQTAIITPIILGTLDVAANPAGDGRRWRRLITLPIRSPILIACVLGVLLGAFGVRLPGVIDNIAALLGAAAVPTALVALGLSLVSAGPADGEPPRPKEVAVAVALKVLVQPAVTFLLARYLLGLHGTGLLAVVICAGLPAAQNTFVYARAYGVDGRFPRDCIVASTALSMVTLTVAAALLKQT
jgi:malonate transporter and related proteins